MTMFSKLVEEYWKIVHLPKGFIAIDEDGKCNMVLYQSEYVRIIIMRSPDTPNMYLVEVEAINCRDDLDSGWQVHETPGMTETMSGNFVN